jgi:hypothetical protein
VSITSSGNASKSLFALPTHASGLNSAGDFAAMADYTHMDMMAQ